MKYVKNNKSGNISIEMRKKYLHKSVDHYWKAKAQNPMRYTH